MEFFGNFISEYGMQILYAIITAVCAWLGVQIKTLCTKICNTKTKKEVAETVVRAVEQIYKELHGEEKLEKALSAAAEMLREKGIEVTDLELRMLVESALAEFNKAFEKDIPAAESIAVE